MGKLKNSLSVKGILKDIGLELSGCLIFAIGLICFVNPANMAPGGIAGISIMLNYLFDLPIGIMSFVLNVPLLIASWFFLGKRTTVKTVRTLIISSAMMDMIITPFVPTYAGDQMLGAIFGGVLMGAGLALIFLNGSTTGGTDIVSYLVHLKHPQISIGRLIMLVDLSILAASIFVFGNMESALFGLISLYVSTKVIDGIIYGVDKGSMILIVSEKNGEIAQKIMDDMERGVTLLHGRGAYTKAEKDVLMCAVSRHQFTQLRRIVHEVDAYAFVVVSETSEIMGEGFKPIQ